MACPACGAQGQMMHARPYQEGSRKRARLNAIRVWLVNLKARLGSGNSLTAGIIRMRCFEFLGRLRLGPLPFVLFASPSTLRSLRLG